MKVMQDIKSMKPKAPDEASPSADGRRDPKLEELAERFSASLGEKAPKEDGELPGDAPTEGPEGTESLRKGNAHEAVTSPFFRGPLSREAHGAERNGEQKFPEASGETHENAPAPLLGKESKGESAGESDAVEAALSQMGRFSLALEPSSSAEGIRSPSSVEPLPEPVRKMVERILVEVPGTSHRQEVRIRLGDAVLPDTDIRIFRDGGRLEVQFLTGSQETRDFLSPHLSSLKEALESRQREPVQVSVAYTGESGGGQNEGRSRERRMVWEEYEA
ncbi:hypothetical protein TDMWS_20490 [Thermodesulfomicrobium sp. WS]|uniref:type III secretion HpaP family protein n=1 Tax=Thermodesulfomicrobium sp. WS TaxID=3004129 RepID=UPI0024926FA3|nr:type III secretion HpaP family protein [Thermodesulfomicrobium sp. WS]BDV01964.1 hypothetical protein TDMWS_20490 [Thermodesulfomicrobium sp. WS]